MRLLVFLACLCLLAQAGAQVSIYECSLHPKVTQSMLDSAGSQFYAPCVEMDSEIDNSTSSMKTITSSGAIHLKSGFHGKGHLHLQIQPKADFEVAVMNYTALNHILRYEKFELGIKLPADIQEKIEHFIHEVPGADSTKLNPFVEWDIRIQAVFNKTGSNVQEFVDGFYTREMVRNQSTNSWDDQGTDYPFRIRFAPPLNGNWTCAVNVELKGGAEVLTSDLFTFKVVESGNPGFAKVHANKKNFERGGQIFMPVGTNLPFDGGPGSAYMLWNNNAAYLEEYPMSYWERYVQLVDSYGTAGGKYIRIMNAAPSSEVEFEKLGNYYDRLMFASEMDKLLDVCHQNGTMIDFCLMYHTPMTVQHNADMGYAWDYGDYWPDPDWPSERPAYCYSSAFNSSDPMDMAYNEDAFNYMKQRYRYYIARYGYSTDIYLFDLINEPWHLSQNTDLNIYPYRDDLSSHGDSVRAAVSKMQRGLSNYIKIHLEHKQHLLGAIGYLSPSYANYDKESGDKNVNDLSWEAENIDVICINNYANRPDRLIVKKKNNIYGNDNNGFNDEENSFAYTFHQLQELYHKPVFMTEVGQGSDVSGACRNDGHVLDVMSYGFTGLAGFNMWGGWRTSDSLTDERILWTGTIRAQLHMNGEDVINTLSVDNGQWLQGREVQKTSGQKLFLEQQYYRSADQKMAVGYIYNRTFNAKTAGCPTIDLVGTDHDFDVAETIGWSVARDIHVQELANNTDYNVDWYSYGTGDYLVGHSYSLNTTSHGEFELQYPSLIPNENPLVWYVIKDESLSGGKGVIENDAINNAASDYNTFDSGNSSPINAFKIFPNPFDAQIKVSTEDAIGYIIISDSQGKIVLQEEYIANLVTINTTHLGQGIYFLHSEKWNVTIKVVKL